MAEPTPRPAPPPSTSRREVKLAIVAVLAGVYLALWPQLTLPAEPPAAGPPAAGPPAAGLAEPAEPVASLVAGPTPLSAAVPAPVWLDTLPASERPPLVLPDGWRLAAARGGSTFDAGQLDATTAPAVASRSRSLRAPVRVAATRRDRVRTRSS